MEADIVENTLNDTTKSMQLMTHKMPIKKNKNPNQRNEQLCAKPSHITRIAISLFWNILTIMANYPVEIQR